MDAGAAGLAERVLAGELVVLRGLDAVGAFVAAARTFVEERVPRPTTVHRRVSREDLAATAGQLQREFRADATLLDAFAHVLRTVGLVDDRTYWDRLHLRVLPPAADGGDAATVDSIRRPVSATRWHRDTWGSGVAEQVNWWLPLWPLSAGRTVQFLPDAFDRVVPNTSTTWDVTALRDAAARARLPLIPGATVPIDDAAAVRPVPAVGDLLVFSGAHLHGTVPNATGRTRFSVETRTVSLDDLEAGRRAPARDSQPPHVAWHWFRRISDGTPLTDVVATGDASPRADRDGG